MLCCFKDNNVATISSSGSNSSLTKEKSGRKITKKKSSKQIIPFEVGVATDANLAQMSNRSSPQMEVIICILYYFFSFLPFFPHFYFLLIV